MQTIRSTTSVGVGRRTAVYRLATTTLIGRLSIKKRARLIEQSHNVEQLVSRNYKLQRQLDFKTVSELAQCYTTDESFFFQNYNGTLVGDGCNLPHYIPDVFLMSIILFMGTFLLSVELKDFKNALFFPSKV